MLWSFMDFKNLAHLRNEAKLFIDQHNQYQNYKNNRYNKLFMLNYKTRQFPDTFSFNKSNDLPITKGYIHFIRFVNEKGYVNILNEEFYISKQLSFGYVWLTIDTAQQYLNVYYRSEKRVPRNLIKTFNYQLRETAKNPIPVMEFC